MGEYTSSQSPMQQSPSQEYNWWCHGQWIPHSVGDWTMSAGNLWPTASHRGISVCCPPDCDWTPWRICPPNNGSSSIMSLCCHCSLLKNFNPKLQTNLGPFTVILELAGKLVITKTSETITVNKVTTTLKPTLLHHFFDSLRRMGQHWFHWNTSNEQHKSNRVHEHVH